MKALGTPDIGNFLKTSAWRYPDKIAVKDADQSIARTYKELNTRVNSLANGLLELGLKKGDFVAVLTYNCIELVEIYFALAKIGAVVAPQVYRLSQREISELVDLCKAKAFIFGNEFSGVVDAIRQKLPSVEHYIGLGETVADKTISFETLAAEYPANEPCVDITEEDPQYLNYTSGTTGLPKAYILCHYNNGVALPMQFDEYRITPDDNVLIVFPMYGRVGFGWTVLSVLKGATIVTSNFSPDTFCSIVEKEKITMVNLVPTMAQMLLSQSEIEKYDLSTLRGIVFAGAPLPQSIYEQTRKRICKTVYEYYGLQETAIITQIRPEMKLKKPASVGVPVPALQIRIVDTAGEDVASGEIGDIIVRGPGVTTGYYNQPDKTAEVIKNGWFYTGDLGRWDDDGYLFLSGRRKDMIVSGGQNVFAPEVEEILLAHSHVSDCAVIGLPHDVWGEAVTAVVLLKSDKAVDEKALIEHCRNHIAHFKSPKSVIFTSDIPRNPAGKVMKFMLVEKYAKSENKPA